MTTIARRPVIYLRTIFSQHKQLIACGAGLAILLFLLKWLQWRFIIVENSFLKRKQKKENVITNA